MSTFFFATTAGELCSPACTIYRLITEISTTDRSGRFLLCHAVTTDTRLVLSSLLGVASIATIFHFEGECSHLEQLLNQCHTVQLLSLPGFLAALPQPTIIILNGCTDQELFNQFSWLTQGVVLGTPAGITEHQSLTFALTFYTKWLFANRTLAGAYHEAITAAQIQPPHYAHFGRYAGWRSPAFFVLRAATCPRQSNHPANSATAGDSQWLTIPQWVNKLAQWLRQRVTLSTHWFYAHRSAQLVALIATVIFSLGFYMLTTGEEIPPAVPPIQLQPAAEQLAPIREGEIIEGLAFGHASNSLFATGIEHSIYQWRLPTGELLPTLDVDTSSVNHIAIDRASSLLTYSGRDGAVGMISLDYQWRRKLEPHAGAIAALHINHHGRALFTGSTDGVLMQHDLISGEGRLLRSEPGAPIGAIVTSPTDELLAFATNQSIQIWRWATREPLYQLVGHQGPVHWLDFSPDGRYLLSASSDQLIYLWDVAGQRIVHQFADATSPVNVVRYFPDGELFIAAGDDGMIRVWDAQSYQKIDEIEGFPGGVAALVINHNGSQIAAAGRNGVIKLWNVVPRYER